MRGDDRDLSIVGVDRDLCQRIHLNYEVPAPLDIILDQETMQKYNLCFRVLLHAQQAKHSLTAVFFTNKHYSFHQSSELMAVYFKGLAVNRVGVTANRVSKEARDTATAAAAQLSRTGRVRQRRKKDLGSALFDSDTPVETFASQSAQVDELPPFSSEELHEAHLAANLTHRLLLFRSLLLCCVNNFHEYFMTQVMNHLS
jgi:hypothetical protein